MKYLIIIPLFFAAVIVGLSFYLQPNDFIGCQDQPLGQDACVEADAIVVVSGGDTSARTDAGIDLFKNGWADTLIFSGAAQDTSGPSNAAAMRSHAIAEGVPADAIRIDELSRTTQENAVNTRDIFEEAGYESVILVTSGYHQRRAAIEFERRAEGMAILNYPVLNDNDWSFWWWLTPRGWWLAGGETAKIIITSIQGDPA
jgi:uncharacterized SAM-binding protein YcdF (DUF218 family)